MSWNSWGEFWAMGGYGLYVWGSYVVCGLVFLIEPYLARRRHGRAARQIRAPENRSTQ